MIAVHLRYFQVVFVLALCLFGCEKRPQLPFEAVPSSQTGIDFSNVLTQTEYFNIIEYLYYYNGGGVAIGDINNDGLQDIYLTANQEQNRLYLNKGGFVFEDVTDQSGTAGKGNWKTGVTMADVNGDGYLDIFVCGVGNYKFLNGENQLLINNGDLTFTDLTKDYGLAFKGFSTHATFFDYDNDGDLDMYLLNHAVHTVRSHGDSTQRFQNNAVAGDRLYRNDLVPYGRLGFTDVTSESGIFSSQIGYGLGIGVSDLDLDGFPDIYISNDFQENDYLYMNQGNGTFRERIKSAMPHGSRFSMGNDIADINNDGWPDVITLDMLPRDEEVIKTTAGEDPYDIYDFKSKFGFHHQFARNTLQLNRGLAPDGTLRFSDIAPLSGVEASDWSWAPLLADFDNDGNKDLFVANGIVTRPNDLDYIHFISSDSAQRNYSYEVFIDHMPSGKVPNYFFRNNGEFRFRDVTSQWVGEDPSLTTGAAYADLDNDGDLDLVLNNVNEKASILRNDLPTNDVHWLQVELNGEGLNTFGIGTKILVYASNQTVYHEQMLSRGWQSSVSPVIHIGLGDIDLADSVTIIWPDKRFQTLKRVTLNQRIKVFQKDAGDTWSYNQKMGETGQPLLTRKSSPAFVHRENQFNAFNSEKLIPHMLSTQGPKISTGDVNGDQLEDLFIGGAAGQPGQIMLQQSSGGFRTLSQSALLADSACEDTGSAFFDADGNGTLDLIVLSGGQEFSGDHSDLRPRLYLNDGNGAFRQAKRNLPELFLNASCVRICDVNGDQAPDIFIGGRVVTGKYGLDPESYLLINDGRGNFLNESGRLNTSGNALGMVTDGQWCDLNADGKPDLIVVGEWMTITVLIQREDGNFVDHTERYGLDNTHGWWNSVEAADFDGDGDMDFVAGNLGLNSRLRASDDRPVTLYAGDIDDNGGIDHLLTYYNDNTEHPFISRDQLVKQVPSFRREFLKYNNFKRVKTENIIPHHRADKFVAKHVSIFASVLLENQGGRFSIKPLPIEAQMFPLFGLQPGDFDGDGNTDLLAVGNLYAVQPDFGRYDAGYGLMLSNDGKGNFIAESHQRSGFLVEGEGRDIAIVRSGKGKQIILVARNNNWVLVFESNAQGVEH